MKASSARCCSLRTCAAHHQPRASRSGMCNAHARPRNRRLKEEMLKRVKAKLFKHNAGIRRHIYLDIAKLRRARAQRALSYTAHYLARATTGIFCRACRAISAPRGARSGDNAQAGGRRERVARQRRGISGDIAP